MTTPKRSPGAHDICIHPNDMHRHTCHSQTSEIDSADAAARGDSRPTGMHVLIHVSTQCFCSYVLMWETNTCGNLSKAVIGGTATLKVLVLPCPCLHQELLITCLPQHQEWDTGRARTRRQHEELSPANNFDMLPCCRFRNVAPRASRRCVLSHQESGTPRGTMTKLPIMLLQVDKSSLTGVHMQESVLEDRFGIVHHIRASCCSQF